MVFENQPTINSKMDCNCLNLDIGCAGTILTV